MPMLLGIGKTLIFEDSFLLSDNIGSRADLDSFERIQTQPDLFRMNFILILVCVKGSVTLKIDLEGKVLAPNDALVVLPGCIGQPVSFSDDFEAFVIGSDSNAEILSGGSAPHDSAIMKKLTPNPVFHLKESEVSELMTYYRLMRNRVSHPIGKFTKNYLQHIMSALILTGYGWVIDECDNLSGNVGPRQSQLFLDFMALVKANYASQRGLGFYADKLCLTPKYLSQVIHDVSGRFAGEWIRDYVIMNAKVMLRSRRHTVQQVADRLGFDNASFFGKYFKSATGMSPRKYMLKP